MTSRELPRGIPPHRAQGHPYDVISVPYTEHRLVCLIGIVNHVLSRMKFREHHWGPRMTSFRPPSPLLQTR